MKNKQLDKVLTNTLYEEPEDISTDDKEDSDKNTEVEKDQEKKTKNIKDVDKEDLEDKEVDPDNEEVAVSIKLNDNDDAGGSIKLISYKRLGAMNSIESLLKLFDIDPEKVSSTFKDRLEITINSPISDFKDQEYKISLMDKTGEISINRPDFKTSIEKHSTVPMGQAVQQSVGEPGIEQTTEPEEESIDLGYLPELNLVFRRTIKNEFFDRILEKG